MSQESQFPQVDRRRGLSLREFVREYRSAGKPVVMEDAIEEWGARSSWTFDYFRSRYGKTLVEVHHFNPGDYQSAYRPQQIQEMPLAEYIDRALMNDWHSYPYYIRDDWKLLQKHKELLGDYYIPQYFFDWFSLLPSFMRLVYPRIFLGPQGAVTPLHVDIWQTHAWLAQLVGRKRWVLFPPDQRALLYGCKVQIDQPNFDQFPLFREAKPIECTIGPGDTIFVPSGWAHEVVSLEPSISLTCNYMGPGCLWSCLKHSTEERVFRRLVEAVMQRMRKPGSREEHASSSGVRS